MRHALFNTPNISDDVVLHQTSVRRRAYPFACRLSSQNKEITAFLGP